MPDSTLPGLVDGATRHLVIRPGRTFLFAETVRDDNGAAIALNGWAGAAEVRSASGRLMVTLTVTVNQAVTGDGVGFVVVVASPDETASSASTTCRSACCRRTL